MHFSTILTTLALAATTTLSQPLELSDPQVPEIVVRGIYAAPLSNAKRSAEPHFDVPEVLAIKREAAPLQVGRRLSRKHRQLEERHYGHHHHHHHDDGSSSVDPSATEAAVEPEPSEDCEEPEPTEDCDDDDEGVTTIYTTIYPSPTDDGSDQPTDSSSDSPAPTESSTPTDSSSAPAPSVANGTNPPQHSTGAVIQASGSPCGDPNATADPSPTSGPNGDENWLNCGVDSDSGWIPPPVYLSNLIYRDLSEVLQQSGNPFSSCEPYLDMFQTMADETGVPTIFLASIALQESGCNPNANGGAGEIGMMQITPEKCPSDGSDCHDAMTNIRIGAQYFKTVLDGNNGNLAQTMGEYNGWRYGLTVAQANNYAICAQHNNLDYLQNIFNGYLQGVDPSSLNMGIYHNTC